jgi:serine/threonine protein kinase
MRLGPYEVTAQIGAGGMGELYRARDTKLGRDVAIKRHPVSFRSVSRLPSLITLSRHDSLSTNPF